MPLDLRHVVEAILELAEIPSTHHGFDMAGMRVDDDEAHLDRSRHSPCRVDEGGVRAEREHDAIADFGGLGLPVHVQIPDHLVHIVAKDVRVLFPVPELIEAGLKLRQVFFDGLVCVALHSGVERSVDPKTVAVDIESVLFRLLHELLAYPLDEMRGDARTRLRVDRSEFKTIGSNSFRLFRGQVSIADHLTDDNLAAPQSPLRVPQGIVIAGPLQHADEEGVLGRGHVRGRLVEVPLSGRLNAKGPSPEPRDV